MTAYKKKRGESLRERLDKISYELEDVVNKMEDECSDPGIEAGRQAATELLNSFEEDELSTTIGFLKKLDSVLDSDHLERAVKVLEAVEDATDRLVEFTTTLEE